LKLHQGGVGRFAIFSILGGAVAFLNGFTGFSLGGQHEGAPTRFFVYIPPGVYRRDGKIPQIVLEHCTGARTTTRPKAMEATIYH
jgi:hypothetical protein